MIKFKNISMKNFVSVGNQPLEIQLDKNPLTVVSSGNGCGKCVRADTEIDIHIEDPKVLELFLKTLEQ